MRFTAKLLLAGLVIPLLLLGFISASIKFQLLNAKFWLATFERHNVYTTGAEALKNYAEGQIAKEGGRKSDAKVITDLITPENLKDITEKNITNFLNYANRQKPELMVYLPVKKIPKDLLPKNYANIPEEIEINTLLDKYGIKAVSRTQIQQFSLMGRAATYFMVLDLSLCALFIFLLFLLTESGSRFAFPGATFIITGLLAIMFFRGGVQPQMGTEATLAEKSLPAQVVFLNILPPLIQEISKGWIVAGIALVGLGVVLLVLRKK